MWSSCRATYLRAGCFSMESAVKYALIPRKPIVLIDVWHVSVPSEPTTLLNIAGGGERSGCWHALASLRSWSLPARSGLVFWSNSL